MLKQFPIYRQLDAMDCGPTCLRMIAAHHGKFFTLETLREKAHFARDGVSARGIIEAGENIGLRMMAVQLPFSSSNEEADFLEVPLPCIVHWNQNHFVVVFKTEKKHVWIADPESGEQKLTHTEFNKYWISDGAEGIVILSETTPQFYEQEGEEIDKQGFGYLLSYLRPYRKLLFQLFLGLLLGSLFQLIFPFLTQAIVDIGIDNQNIGFIWLILAAQLMIFFGQTVVQVLQSWILLHVSTRINVSLISDFLVKMMRLPIAFFDTKMIGGMQEIKLQNSEHKHRRRWTNIQAKLFRANIRSLTITQYQDVGANSISQLKDILISFVAATAVINGQMTLGMMLAVQYIVGQLNAPLQQLIGFIRTGQDAKISLERLGEIHNREDEQSDS